MTINLKSAWYVSRVGSRVAVCRNKIQSKQVRRTQQLRCPKRKLVGRGMKKICQQEASCAY